VRPRLHLAVVLLVLAALTACSSDDEPPASTGSGGGASFAAQVASTDLYAGASQRVQVGVFSTTQDGTQLLTSGQVQFAFSYLGPDGSGQPEAGPVSTASYVPAPGTPAGSGTPVLSDPGDARGVYQASDVMLDRAGIWTVVVTAEIPGAGAQQLQAAFTVAERPTLLVPGEDALRTKNLTLASHGVPPSAIDSRAQDGDPVPDPDLHRWTIARAMAQHRPALVLFATPLYCLSQFCGPSADGLQQLADAYPDDAVYIHVEIWRDFDQSVVNQAAADWLWPDRSKDLNEPYLYLIDADGKIVDRWSPLFDLDEVAAELEALPGGGS
jgi:hypothetical protein